MYLFGPFNSASRRRKQIPSEVFLRLRCSFVLVLSLTFRIELQRLATSVCIRLNPVFDSPSLFTYIFSSLSRVHVILTGRFVRWLSLSPLSECSPYPSFLRHVFREHLLLLHRFLKHYHTFSVFTRCFIISLCCICPNITTCCCLTTCCIITSESWRGLSSAEINNPIGWAAADFCISG